MNAVDDIGLREYLARVLSLLVEIDTSDPANYDRAISTIRCLARQLGLTAEQLVIPEAVAGGPGRVNLIIRHPNPGKQKVIFYTHVDVVPAQDPKQFEPRIEGDKLFGRGSADIKASIAAFLGAFKMLRDQDLEYDVLMIVTTDEETDQTAQLRMLFAEYLGDVEGAIIIDLDTDAGGVQIAGLGALQFELTVRGKSSHSGTPHLGENAIVGSKLVIERMQDLEAKIRARDSQFMAPTGYGMTCLKPTLSLTKIAGGTASNVIPERCVLTYDRRLIPEETLEEAEAEIVAYVRQELSGVELKIANRFEPYSDLSPRTMAFAGHLLGIVREVAGEGQLFGVPGSGDLFALAKEYGFSIVGTGPIRADNDIHGSGEFVYLSDVEDLAKIIAKFLQTPSPI